MDENNAPIAAILMYEVIEDSFLQTDIDDNSVTDLRY